jgi:hypothetical protein
MQPMTAYINQLSWRRELPPMASGGDPLKESAKRKECHNDTKNGHVPILQYRLG